MTYFLSVDEQPSLEGETVAKNNMAAPWEPGMLFPYLYREYTSQQTVDWTNSLGLHHLSFQAHIKDDQEVFIMHAALTWP